MSNKKQSSVEWFAMMLAEQGLLVTNDYDNLVTYKEAKAMHQKEIEDAYIQSMKDNMIAPLEFEVYKPEADEYYKETFGGNNE
jgi:hypothetical protein